MRLKSLTGFLVLLGWTAAGFAASVPSLQSRGNEPLSDSDRSTLAVWALAQAEVKSHVGESRMRFLRGGSEIAKNGDGQEYRRAVLYYRNYDSGVVNEVEIDLDSGAITVRDRTDQVQPNREEVEAALAVVARDPQLGPLLKDSSIYADGGFYARSLIERDPCSKDVCLQIHLMNAGAGAGWTNRLIVNLSKGTIANRNYQSPTVEGQIVPMTDPGAN